MVVDTQFKPNPIGRDGLRRFVPVPGRYYKMQLLGDYTERNIPPWTNGLVMELREDEALLSFGEAGSKWIPFSHLSPPIGWHPYYDVHLSADELEKFTSWMDQMGVAIYFSHLIGDGTISYLPLNADGTPPSSPGWRYPEVTDIVPPSLTPITFRLYRREVIVEVCIEQTCEYCKGKGTRLRTKVNSPSTPSEWGQPMDCWTCTNGRRQVPITSLPEKQRKAEVKRLRSDGWIVSYHRQPEGSSFYSAEKAVLIRDLPLGGAKDVIR